MSLSARRRRRRFRLGLIFGVLLLVAGGVGLRWAMVSGDATDTAVDPRRDAGIAAFSAGDEAEVIAQLGPYVRDGGDDVEAMFALASTQMKRADRDPALMIEAISGLRRVLNKQPAHAPAAELLLPVFTDFPRGVEEEGLRIADRLLRAESEHPVALRAKAVFLANTGRDQEALAVATTYLQKKSADVRLQRLALDLMKRRQQPSTALLDYAEALRQSDPQQPAFALVQAYAYLIADDRESATQVLDALTQQSPSDEAFVREQVSLMDGANMFGQVLSYLEKLHGEKSAALPIDELIRRRFESGRGQEAMALIETLERPTVTQRTLRALGLMGLNRVDEAQSVIAEFEATDGRANRAIAALLSTMKVAGRQGLDAVIDAGREVQDAGVRNPYLDLVVAEAYEQSGQADRAITRYQSALRQRPSWAAPCLGLAELYLSQDNPSQAVGYAAAAVHRQPTGINGRILLAEAFAGDPTKLSGTQKNEVLSLIDQVQRAQPGEPRTMSLRISVLAGTGEIDAAKRAMRRALTADPPLNQSAMVTLIEAAKRYGLDPEGETQAAYVERFGQTLAITMVQAQRLIETGEPDAALALFERARPAEPTAEWDANRALLLERLGSPDATAAWSTAGSDYADNLQVQQAQLGSAAAWQDRPAIKDAIQRMRTITGDDEPRWRLEQARWLLASDDPVAAATDADALLDAALKIEPELAEALALRGRAQRLLGNPRLAVSLLSQAVTLSPNDADARAELALAQRDGGSTEDALNTARAAAAMDHASPNAQRRAAQLMIDGEQYAEAAGVLARLESSGQADGRDLFTLAQLYRQTQQPQRALALIESMLAEPTSGAVALAADLYAQADQPERAAAALDLLNDLGLTEADVRRVQAAYYSAYGDSATADAAWVALVESTPNDAAAWTQLVSYRLRDGRPMEAIGSAQAAAAKLPGEAGFGGIVAQAAAIDRLADEPGATGLSLAILEDEEYRVAAIDALKELDRARTSGQSAETLANRLVALADASPDFETLWVLSVSHEFDVGREASALSRAAAARERFPESAQSARLAAEVYAATGQWRESLLATEVWASLLTSGRWEADVLAARAHRELGRPSASLALLSSYAEAVRQAPAARPDLTKELTLAWAGTGQVESTREVLEPLLDQGVRWRMAWLDAAVLSVPSTRQAGRWLETLDTVMPAEAWNERGALAQAWWQLGMRDSFTPFREQGRAMAESLAQGPGASAGLWFFVGSAAELDRDYPAAQEAYRQAVAMDPAFAGASNNLAMLLTDHEGDLAEAAAFARSAIASEPDEPNYYDTLAYVLKRAGKIDEARAAIEQAIELDPGNPAWRARLNEMAVVE